MRGMILFISSCGFVSVTIAITHILNNTLSLRVKFEHVACLASFVQQT